MGQADTADKGTEKLEDKDVDAEKPAPVGTAAPLPETSEEKKGD